MSAISVVVFLAAWEIYGNTLNPIFLSGPTKIAAAFVELAAAGIGRTDVVEAWLGCTADGAVDPEPGFRSLLGAVAPDAVIHVVRWRVG